MKQEIISHFKEKPKTKTARQAMYLGLATFITIPFLGFFAAVIRPLIDKIFNENIGAAVGFLIGPVALIIPIFALVYCFRAFRQGERSWVMWFGFVPAILVTIFWVFMIVGELAVPH